MQQKTGHQKGQGGPDTGGKRDQNGTPDQPEECPGRQGHHRRPRQRESSDRHIEQKKTAPHQPRRLDLPGGEMLPTLPEGFQSQQPIQLEVEERYRQSYNHQQQDRFFH